MPATEALGQPLFLISMLAVITVGLWASFYLGRGAAKSRPPESPPEPQRFSAQSRMPVAAEALVAPLAPPRAPEEDASVPRATFADVAGLDEAVEEMRELKEYLLDPSRFSRLGASLPKGVLLVGPPGTGKTLLTKALAGEAGVPFQVVSAASLVEVYVGVGASRVRQVFAQARKKAPSIILLDELDAIGRTRARQAAGGQEERESTLNQLLLEMDGFDPAAGVLVVGATNRPDVLDPALLRPGRFDRRLFVNPPDLRGRRAILEVHSRNKPLGGGASLDAVARRTTGFTGADLANVMNEAALLSGRRRKPHLGPDELEEAIDRTMSGPQRLSQVISEGDKRMIAYHEAGHALVGRAVARGHEVHRISIVARGQSHGYTLSVPVEDRLLLTRSELTAQLAVLLAGRVAEEVVFGDPTTGAEEDLSRATALAQKMVREYGMSEAAGLRTFGPAGEPDGADGLRPALSSRVDAEIDRLIEEAHTRARAIVSAHREHLDALASRLITAETLEKSEIDRLLTGVARDGAPPAAGRRSGATEGPALRRRPAKPRARSTGVPSA
ncbi:MAG: Cell division protein FtsH [uncultured Acidimicrobiales bacterium]|uniref:ATP-dependent zinc metalloprotease FtsH n=1 Tax=uncultured Acidimicrobiales bacterium TaxID=310071 RepID=A0A6J4HE61_9ACTN|nr:MAG: Cell division protein FtsH [uncultured Acidimicrobiales bacterium]